MDHAVAVLEGEREADCGFIPLSEELEQNFGATDFWTQFIVCVLLEDADVALISRFYLDYETFMNA